MKTTGNGMKKTLAGLVVAGVLSTGVAAFASTALTPAGILDELTTMSLEEVQAARAEGETYGSVAIEYGVSDDFRKMMLENRKLAIQERVDAGTMTQEDADALLAAIEAQIAECDGTGTGDARLGQTYGAGFGQGSGAQDGTGRMSGEGSANGQGRGQMLRDGTGAATGRGMARGSGVHVEQ